MLKDYLIKGYAINEKIKDKQYNELKQTVRLLSKVLETKNLSADEATGLLQVITESQGKSKDERQKAGEMEENSILSERLCNFYG